MKGLLFPDYVECSFLNGYRCESCGQSGQPLQVAFPSLAWRQEENSMVIMYPVRCPCGKSGLSTTHLPFLLFCFICGWLKYRDFVVNPTPCSLQEIRPNESPILTQIYCEFEEAVEAYGRRPSRPTPVDRILFRMSPETWPGFLKRLGFTEDEAGLV